ncbi:MAG TPA: cytochrome-c oxidase, cbb3-type subunit III [Devosia sp.]|nr:cytochrome-c oxidase, cbb3-type subunit III [Devosia sp.]
MALKERDKFSGHMTTGHEWNGIKELNSPVPRIVWAFLICTALFAVTWTVLMPSWPGIHSYFRGLLGVDQRTSVAETVAQGVIDRANWADRFASDDIATIQADPGLMTIVRESGNALFGDNCAACHAIGGTGNPGYPNIAAAPMMWGDEPETIMETIRVGINSAHPDTRFAQMPAFGRDQMLDSAQIDTVVSYVQTLSDPALAATTDATLLAEGATLFAENCAACHGEDAKGMVETGAPNLTDAYWTYGGDRATIRHTVYGGRQGLMPTWETRLSPLDIKLLALYVLDLRAKAE